MPSGAIDMAGGPATLSLMGAKAKAKQAARLDAFERIVHQYEGPLLRYSAHVLDDIDAAQDVVQEAFIRLLHHWKDAWEPSPKLSTWLYRVAHNCAVDHLRHRARRRVLHHKAALEMADYAPADRGASFRVSDRAARAKEALQTLSLRDRQLVILKVYEEKSYKEISAITGLSVSNVGYCLHHAMKKLAAALREDSES